MNKTTENVERAKLKIEYELLLKEYKNMEATRKSYSEDSLNIIKKQKETIEKIDRENQKIKDELDSELRFLNKKSISNSAATQLHDQLDLYIGKVELEQKTIEELEEKIEEVRSKFLKDRRAVGGVNASKEIERQLERKIKVLENRLEKALVRFNEVLATNKELRSTIDSLRQERTVFENVCSKLDKELLAKKQELAGLIESSNQAFEARDIAQMEATRIAAEAAAERVQFEQQLASIDAAVDAEVDFERQKDFEMRGSLTMEEEEELKRGLQEGRAAVLESAAAARALAAKVEEFEVAFNRIRSEIAIDDVEELVMVFLRNEDSNFALFSFVSAQTEQIQALEEELLMLRDEILRQVGGRKLLEGVLGQLSVSAKHLLGTAALDASVSTPTAAASSTSNLGVAANGNNNGGAPRARRGSVAGIGPGAGSSAPGGADALSPTLATAESLASSIEGIVAQRTALSKRLKALCSVVASIQKVLATRYIVSEEEQAAEEANSFNSEKKKLEDLKKRPHSKGEKEKERRLDEALAFPADGDENEVTEAGLVAALAEIEQKSSVFLAGYAALLNAAKEEEKSLKAQSSPTSPMRSISGGSAARSPTVGSSTVNGGNDLVRPIILSLAGSGPVMKPGAAAEMTRPAVPAVSDFAVSDVHDTDDDDDERSLRPLSVAEIKLATIAAIKNGSLPVRKRLSSVGSTM